MEIRNEKVLAKLIDNESNLKELLNVTRLGKTYTIVEMGRAAQWVKALQ